MTLSDAIQVIRAPFAVYAHEGDGFMGSWDFVHVSDTGTISTGTMPVHSRLMRGPDQESTVAIYSTRANFASSDG